MNLIFMTGTNHYPECSEPSNFEFHMNRIFKDVFSSINQICSLSRLELHSFQSQQYNTRAQLSSYNIYLFVFSRERKKAKWKHNNRKAFV